LTAIQRNVNDPKCATLQAAGITARDQQHASLKECYCNPIVQRTGA